MMHSEVWHRCWCPKCNKVNWVCDGDLSDLTAMDVDGYECWSCGEECFFNETFIRDFYGMIEGEDFDIKNHDFNIEKGLERPI